MGKELAGVPSGSGILLTQIFTFQLITLFGLLKPCKWRQKSLSKRLKQFTDRQVIAVRNDVAFRKMTRLFTEYY